MIIIIILCLCVCTLIFSVINLLKKTEILEETAEKQQEYINSLSQIIEISSERLKELDEKGSFESDDEIGFFFKGIKDIQEILNEFNITKNG